MKSRFLTLAAILAALLLALVVFWRSGGPAPELKTAPRPSGPAAMTKTPARNPRLARLAEEIGTDAISPIAQDLNAPGGTIRHDLELLNQVFVAWQTNFPHDGNPVGENDEITVALAGENRLRFAFVAPTHPAINARGELCDRWGTPFRFHQMSGTVMEIRSAGPDRKFGTADDVEFSPEQQPVGIMNSVRG